MTFLAAGHETSSSAMIWAVFVFSQPRYRGIQTRLCEEIRSNLANPATPSSSVTVEGLENLTYLNAVSNEVLRMFAPAPWLMRSTSGVTTLMGTRIPKGTDVRISPWVINQSLALCGSDSLEFNPDRWLIGDKAGSGGADRKSFSLSAPGFEAVLVRNLLELSSR